MAAAVAHRLPVTPSAIIRLDRQAHVTLNAIRAIVITVAVRPLRVFVPPVSFARGRLPLSVRLRMTPVWQFIPPVCNLVLLGSPAKTTALRVRLIAIPAWRIVKLPLAQPTPPAAYAAMAVAVAVHATLPLILPCNAGMPK